MKKYGLIVFNPDQISDSIGSLKLNFKLTTCQSFNSLQTLAAFREDHIILIDVMADVTKQFELINAIKNDVSGNFDGLSIVLLVESLSLEERLKACEVGADDCILHTIEPDELVTRLRSTIYNSIANRQLRNQLKAASEAARMAQSNTGDMEVNIRFLLDSHHCANLDQLGQLLFKSLNYLGLNCSLQMRSRFQTKNMEAHGMERAMESKLLNDLKDAGHFYDFGNSSVINWGSVSLLIKNMPQDEPEKYRFIKSSVSVLLQGADARLQALDHLETIQLDQQQQKGLIAGLHEGMEKLETHCLRLTTNVSKVVEHTLASVEQMLPTLHLTDEQEAAVLNQLKQGRENVSSLVQGKAVMDQDLNALLNE